MAGYHPWLLLQLLLGLTLGQVMSWAPSNYSCQHPLSVSGRPCNATATYAPTRNSTQSASLPQGTATHRLNSSFPASRTGIGKSSISIASAAALAEAASQNSTTVASILPSVHPQKFDHTIYSVQSAAVIDKSTFASTAGPTNTSANAFHKSSLRNASSQTITTNVSISEAKQSLSPTLNTSSMGALAGNDTRFSNFLSVSKIGPTSSSLAPVNISRLTPPPENASSCPPFPNITSNQKLVDVSYYLHGEPRTHPSKDNIDLYPPTYVTTTQQCPLNQTSKSSLGLNGTLHRSTRRQAKANGDLYPPGWSACAERDADFFEFTEKNIQESGVIGWYARWTVEARESHLQDFNHHGEWRFFYRWWLQEHDFRCGYDFSVCRNAKTRKEVQDIYPGEANRQLVQRVYFVSLMYDYLHDHTRMMEETFTNLHVDLSGHIPDLIQSFTQHGDPHGEKLCKIYQTVIQATVNAAIGLMGTVAAGFQGVWMPNGGAIDKILSPSVIWKAAEESEQASVVRFDLYSMWTQPLAQQWTVSNWQQWQTLVSDRITKDNPTISTGMGRGWSGMCASDEGDFQDQSAGNQEQLKYQLSETFQHTREGIYDTFHAIYSGAIIPRPGNPSFMAAIMAHRKWTGDNSIVSEIEDTRPVLHVIRSVTLKQIISKLLSESQNWMKCTHDARASEMCEKATKARAQGSKGYKVDRSRFCPHPESDPTYICEVGAWYFSEDHQHQRPMSALDTLEPFWNNEFNFTLQEFLEEVHDNYERCHNKCAQMRPDALAFDPDMIAAQGFAIPVCVSHYVKLDDFLKRGAKRWHFPSFCGGFTSNETEGFMQAANMGHDSQAAKNRIVQQLWRDRIPRELEGLRPFSYYMALCKHGIRFPDKWEWNRKHGNHNYAHNMKNAFNKFQIPYHHEPCKHCGWVEENTRGMDEMEANHYFCESRYVWDNILTKQASHIDMLVAPTKRFENLRTKCVKWMKGNGGKPPYKPKALWREDIEDGAMLILGTLTVPFSKINGTDWMKMAFD